MDSGNMTMNQVYAYCRERQEFHAKMGRKNLSDAWESRAIKIATVALAIDTNLYD